MLWFLMRLIAYGFETVVIIFMTLIGIGIVHDKKPEWLDFIFDKLFLVRDDE